MGYFEPPEGRFVSHVLSLTVSRVLGSTYVTDFLLLSRMGGVPAGARGMSGATGIEDLLFFYATVGRSPAFTGNAW